MKKANLSPKHQARRERALNRLTIRPRRDGEDKKTYDAYVERRGAERQTLEARLAGRQA